MKSYQQLFLVFCLVITLGILQLWNKSQLFFSPVKSLEHEIHQYQTSLQKEKLRTSLAMAQLKEYQESVAVVMPESVNTRLTKFSDYQMMQLGSMVRSPASEPLELSGVYMSKAKSSFKQRRYKEAVEEFKQVVERFPSSMSVPEAHFMMAESYYLNNQPGEALDTIDKMITLFPENEMTGFIMLRMGQIFQDRKKPVQASEVYKSVIMQYGGSNLELKRQAEKLLKTTEG
jgi:TolA-binding protein